MRRAILTAMALVAAAACTPERVVPVVRHAHADPAAIVASADGRRFYVACGPQKAVAVIGVASRALEALFPVGSRPRGVAVSPDGAAVAVSLPDEDRVAVFDANSFQRRAEVQVGLEPAGLAFSRDGKRLFVANARSGDISIVDVAAARQVGCVTGGREPFAVAVSPDGATVAVASRSANIDRAECEPHSEVTLLDAASGAVTRRVLLDSCHMGQGLAFTPDGSRILLAVIRVRNLLPIVQVDRGWVMSTVLASIDVATGRVALLPLNGPCDSFPDPTAIALTADGARAFVASGSTDRVCDVDLAAARRLEPDAGAERPEHLSWTRRYVTSKFGTGPNPCGVAVAGSTVAVAERLGDSVALFGCDGALAARVPIVLFVPDDAVRRGDRVFHDARYAFQSSFSCGSCHPDLHTDGLTYDFEIDGVGRNVVLNRSLRGIKGTGPFKWTGKNATIGEQCGPRFAKVLTRADPFPDDDLADIVAYIESLAPPRPDPRAGIVGGKATGAVARGRAIFERTTRRDGTPIAVEDRCVTCHPPPHYSSFRRAGVGTQGDHDDTGTFDVPHLTGIGSKAPYLHDGRALSLEAIWTGPDVGDLHGAVTDLGKTDLNDLVEFLKGL
jgi:YVTN family beta-propeller protein